jgi:hypothetical protein
MADDTGRPAVAGDPAGAGDAEGVGDGERRAPGAGNNVDRRNVVYLVPAISGPADFEVPGGNATDQVSSTGTPAAPQRIGESFDRPGPGAASAPPDGGDDPDPTDGQTAEPAEHEDWAWVQEWRAGQEPTPWATGIALAVFSALIVGIAVWVLSAGLADRPVIAVLVNLLVAGGLTPAIWLSRGLPVLRWIAAGTVAGIVIGWVCAILMLPLPTA